MSLDPFKPGRDCLTVARVSLAASRPITNDYVRRIEALEHQLDPERTLDWRGDARAAADEIEQIIDGLRKLTATRPGVATGTNKLTQNPAKVALPGVDDALVQLWRAYGHLV